MNKRALVWALIALGISAAVDWLLLNSPGAGDRNAGHAFWPGIPGFFAGFGIVSCIAIVIVAKTLGRLGLQVDPSYYDQFERTDAGGRD